MALLLKLLVTFLLLDSFGPTLIFSQDSCTETSECEGEQQCILGSCQCPNLGNSYYRDDSKRCFLRIGASCEQLTDKQDGRLTCDSSDTVKPSSLCSLDPRSPTGYSCSCNKEAGYLPGYGRRCSKGYGESCALSEWETCSYWAGLACWNGQCECKMGSAQRWNDKIQRCVSLEEEECGNSVDFYEDLCDDGLECVRNSVGNDMGVCRKPL